MERARIWVAGDGGMLGSAIVRRLKMDGIDVLTASRSELDLEDQHATTAWIAASRPDAILVAAARLGGILAHSDHPGDFLFSNLMIAANIIHGAHLAGVGRVVHVASSAVYPAAAPQPIQESSLLAGPLDPFHEPYAIAKIAGMKLCDTYRKQFGREYFSIVPTNLYGPGSNFDLRSAHVLPALLRKVHEAKAEGSPSVTIWGSGTPRREFLHVDDCADACVFLLNSRYSEGHINVGSGSDISISDLAVLIAEVIGFTGRIECDTSKPDGASRRLLSSKRLNEMGWHPKIEIRDGIADTYRSFLEVEARWPKR